MHVCCVSRGVKRPDIVKEILPCGHWNQRCLENEANNTLDVTKFKFNNLFVDRFNVQMFCKNNLFSNMYKFNES